MVAGLTGFCLVQFGSEKAFKSKVPNVNLEKNKPKKRAKAKAKPAAVDDDRDREGKMDDGAQDPAGDDPAAISAEDIDAKDVCVCMSTLKMMQSPLCRPMSLQMRVKRALWMQRGRRGMDIAWKIYHKRRGRTGDPQGEAQLVHPP